MDFMKIYKRMDLHDFKIELNFKMTMKNGFTKNI